MSEIKKFVENNDELNIQEKNENQENVIENNNDITDPNKTTYSVQTFSSNYHTIFDLWENSLLFRLILTFCSILSLIFLLGISLTLSASRYDYDRVLSAQIITSNWTNICFDCLKIMGNQYLVIKSLENEIKELNESSVKFQENIENANKTKENLIQKLDEVNKIYEETKRNNIIWQIGTIGGISIGGGAIGLGFYANTLINKIDEEIKEISRQIYLQKYYLEYSMNSYADEYFMKVHNNYVERIPCFDSQTDFFSKTILKEKCSGYTGPGLIFEMRNSANVIFGAYIKTALPSDSNDFITDQYAFIYTLTNGKLAGIRSEEANHAFKFDTDDTVLFILGNNEIKVMSTQNQKNTMVYTDPGISYEFIRGSRPYHPELYFEISSLIVYKINIHYN